MKKIKFPLKMADDKQVRTLEELRENFDLAAVLGYYDDGRLTEWLTDRYYENEAEQVKSLNPKCPNFKQQLCEVLGAAYSADETMSLEEIAARNERLAKLKQFTAEDTILAAIDRVAFSQEELADLLDDDVTEIYLCGDKFSIPGSVRGITYIGVNNPKVDFPKDFRDKGIVLQGLDTGAVDINIDVSDILEEAEELREKYNSYRTDKSERRETADKMLELYSKAAEQGNSAAQNALGELYNQDNDTNDGYIAANFKEAVEWFRKAAEQNNADAHYNLFNCYDRGIGVEQSITEANKHIHKAAELNHAVATYNLGNFYAEGKLGLSKDNKEAMKCFHKAAEDNKVRQNSWFKERLGNIYFEGEITSKNYEEAVKWYHKALVADPKTKSPFYNLGVCYRDGGFGLQRDENEATKWLVKAAANSYPYVKDDKKDDLVKYLKQKAEQGNADAQYGLGKFFRDGVTTLGSPVRNEDYEREAPKWFRKAAEQGHAEACYELYECYRYGKGVEESELDRKKWLRKAAENGHLQAMNVIGNGSVKDHKEAIKWTLEIIKREPNHNLAIRAYNKLGLFYRAGAGCEMDKEEAFYMFQKAAELGEEDAYYNLGICYDLGQGVQKDRYEAIKWYRKAVAESQNHSLYAVRRFAQIENASTKPVATFKIDKKACKRCGKCAKACLTSCISKNSRGDYEIGSNCIGCAACQLVCPAPKQVIFEHLSF
ncbi:MAG: hypothetical protein FWG63_00005 [Defluviitaleaceae bacterium]|nr:hypothetical protein [Defluviitaleaceae bacterium]